MWLIGLFLAPGLGALADHVKRAAGTVLTYAILFVVVMAIWIWIASRAEKKRTGQFQQFADLSARRFVPQDDGSLLERLQGLPLFSKGRDKRIANLLYGERTAHYIRGLRDGELATFDYRYRTGSGKFTHTWEQSVFYLRSPALCLPQFEVRPRGWLGIRRGIPVETHPEFSENYLLLGDDEPAIQALLSYELMAFLATQVKLCVEGSGDQLVVYRAGKRLKLDQVEQLEQIGLQVFALLPHSAEA